MEMNPIAGAGLMTAAIYATMEFLKYLGWRDKKAAVSVVVLGLGLGLIQQLIVTYPQIAPWYEQAMLGLLAGLAAAGIYGVQKNIRH